MKKILYFIIVCGLLSLPASVLADPDDFCNLSIDGRTYLDTDCDNVADRFDNCLLVKNGDCDVDDDGDGVPDFCDPDVAGFQFDMDGDGEGDDCDDIDGDGLLDTWDNCPLVANTAPGAYQLDSNADGVIDLGDAIHSLNYLFNGGRAPTCPDASDSDDNGVLEIADPVRTLYWLFQGRGELPDPGPDACGIDPTEDSLPDCEFEPARC